MTLVSEGKDAFGIAIESGFEGFFVEVEVGNKTEMEKVSSRFFPTSAVILQSQQVLNLLFNGKPTFGMATAQNWK